jgi:hypothetical protein
MTASSRNIGDQLAFEQPYWAGRYPVLREFEHEDPYPLPFHPLDLGERTLVEFFGFCIEGYSGDDVKPVIDIFGDVSLGGYQVAPRSSS